MDVNTDSRSLTAGERFRVTWRSIASAAVAVTLFPLHLMFFAPRKDFETVPRLAGALLRRIAGIDVDVYGAEKLKERAADGAPRLYAVGPHMSGTDIPVFQELIGQGLFLAKSDISGWPGIGAISRAMGTLFTKKGANGAGIPDLHRGMARSFNKGRNIIVFPEGTTGDGERIKTARAGALSAIFNEANMGGVTLEKPVKAQIIVQRLVDVDGQSVDGNPELRDIYFWKKEMSFLKNLRNIFARKSLHLEIAVLDEIDPEQFQAKKGEKIHDSFAQAVEQAMAKGLEDLKNGAFGNKKPGEKPERQPVFQ